MSLDIFQQDRDASISYALGNSAPDLPAGFSDTFEANWNLGQYFGQSLAQQNTRMSVLSDITEDLYRRTGDASFLNTGLTPQGLPDPAFQVDHLNDKIDDYREANPAFAYPDLTEDDIQARMVQKSRAARQDAAAMAGREHTWGGTFGALAGTLASQASDPVNLVAALFAPEGVGLLAAALKWGAIAGGSQAANEIIASPYREQVQPGYGASAEPAANVLEAAAGGAVLGGGIKGLAEAWGRYKPFGWARSVRDAGNVVESEAQIQGTNPFPDAAGETAHRDALSSAIDSIADGRPVDVDHLITPQQADVIAAHSDGSADYWEQRLADATPEQRASFGATDTPAVSEIPETAVKVMRDDPQLSGAIEHDFQHLQAEHGDMMIPVGETVDETGTHVPVMRSVNDLLTEADRREKAANEILACLTPEAL